MNSSMLLVAIVGGMVVISLLWRFISTKQSLPCPSWLGWMVEMDNPLAKVTHAASIVRDSGMTAGMTVLDAGCGPGRVTIPAAEKVGENGCVVALDIQEEMLQRVRKKAEAKQLNNISFLQAGLGEGELEPESFDRAVMVMVIGEIPNQKAALEEVYTALKPGGVLTVTEMIFDPHFQPSGRIVELAEATGFRKQAHFGGRLAYSVNLVKE